MLEITREKMAELAVDGAVDVLRTSLSEIGSNDSVAIALFGLMYFIFGYGIVSAYYLQGLKKVQNTDANLSAIIGKAIMIQVFSLLFSWFILMSITFFAKYSSSTNMDYSTATVLFFKINWLEVDLNAVLDNFQNSNSSITTIGMYLLIQIIWVIFTVSIILVPLGLVVGMIYIIYKRNVEQKHGESSYVDILSNSLSTLLMVMIIFAIHFALPAVFLDGLAKDHYEEVSRYTNGLDTIDDFYYSSRVKAFIEASLDTDTEE